MEGAILVHCSIANNDYQQDSIVLHTFVPNISLSQLLYIPPKNFIFLKTSNLELSRDRSKINITLVINQSVKNEK